MDPGPWYTAVAAESRKLPPKYPYNYMIFFLYSAESDEKNRGKFGSLGVTRVFERGWRAKRADYRPRGPRAADHAAPPGFSRLRVQEKRLVLY